MKGLREASRGGLSRHKRYTHGQTNFAFHGWSWGDSHRVGTRDNGGRRENCVHVCVWPSQQYSPHYPITQAGVTFQEISTDVGLGPQLSRRSSREGLAGVK